MEMTELRHVVDESLQLGWVLLQISPDSSLLEIGRALGEPIPSRSNGPLVDILRVIDAKDAKGRSLSARYGTGAFPWHTDMAHIRIPPRFVVMRSLSKHEIRPTFLFDSKYLCRNEKEEAGLRTEVWLVNGGRGCFLSPILNDTILPGAQIFRYDACVMRPMWTGGGQSMALVKALDNQRASAVIDWRPGLCLVLDNWRMLHARAPRPDQPEHERLIERVLVRT
jgi:hypothetical protein